MSYKSLTCLVILFCISFHSNTLGQMSGKKKKGDKPLEIISPVNPPKDYEVLWRQIDSLDNLNMTKSAKDIAGEIYQMAIGRNNSRQALKALIVKLSYEKKLDTQNKSRIINELKKESPRFSFPESNIIKAVLGRVYQEYYVENSYKMMNRSQILNDTSSDFETWSPGRMKHETISLFEASMENAEELKKIPAPEFSGIIYDGNEFGDQYRPTLYDMLCHQALDCFMNFYFNLDKFEMRFSEEPGLMGTFEEFLRLTADPNKKLLMNDPAIRVLRNLSLFHMKDTVKYELADIDLQRLEYFRREFQFMTVDSLYIQALQRMLEFYTDRISRPRILAALANAYYQRSGYYINNPAYRAEKKKALELCNQVIHDYPGSFGARQAEGTKKEILRKYFYLDTEQCSLPGEAFRVQVSSTNIDKVYFRIISADSAVPDSVIKDREALLKFYLRLRPYKYFNQVLSDSGDYFSHKYNVIMPALPIGKYIIAASADSGFSINSYTCFESIFITNLSVIVKTEDNIAQLYVLDRKTGKPLEDVRIDISGREKFNLAEVESRKISLTTDEDGYADATLLYGYYHIKLSKGKDLLEIPYNPEYGYVNELDGVKGETYFFLDRTIYRPGQRLFFKGLTLVHDKTTGEHSIWEKGDLTVKVTDPKNNEIGKIKLTTNEYGTFSGEIDLPVNILTGSCTIRDGFSEAHFQVEEYKRPQFEVKVDKIKEEYNLDDQVHLTGRVEAFSGAGLSGAEVHYRVERMPVCFYGNRRYMGGYSVGTFQVAAGRVQADSIGEFSVNFKTVPDAGDKINKPVYRYRVSLEAKDKTGETHKAETSLMAGYVSLLTDINIPDVVVKNEKQDFEIITKDLNGNFKPSQVDISLFKLKSPGRVFRQSDLREADSNLTTKEEFYRLFKHDAFSDENKVLNWQIEKQTGDTSFVTRENITLSSSFLSRLEQGRYLLKLSAKDKNGNPVEVIRYFTLLDPDARKMPLNYALWMQPLKFSAEPGEKLKVSLGTALDEMNILFEVKHRGKVVKQEWLSLKNEQKIIEVPVKEKYRGGIILSCYAVWENSVYSFYDRIDVPWSNKKLKVELSSFRNKITPGETEQWKLKVSDQSGEPVKAEVLAAMYDESLDQLSDPNDWEFNIYDSNHDLSFRRSYWDTESSFRLTNLRPALWESQDSYYQPSVRYNEFYYYGLINGYYETYGDKKYKSRTFEASLFRLSPFKSWVNVNGNKPEIHKDFASGITIQAGIVSTGIRGGRISEVGYSIEMDPKTLMDLKPNPDSQESFMKIIPRKNLSETAFFMPHLITNSNGIAEVNFKAPEALTKWKFMAFSLTEDLEGGMLTSEVVTQKSLMVQNFPPRFFRENDTIWYTARVSNLTDSTLSGHVQLMTSDASAMTEADSSLGNEYPLQELHLEPKETKVFKWKLTIPEGKFNSVNCRVLALCGSFSDGEENLIPVLGNRMLITESMPLPVMGNENRSFTFENLLSNKSSSLKNYRLTLEFTSNPAFLALEALPSLMGYNFESADNIFNGYYACSIAMHVANSSPELKKVFDSWKASGKETLSSSLKKNSEMKNILLEETPWLGEAQNEEEQKARLGELFDYTKLRQKLDRAEDLLRSMQTETGGWTWFPGMRENICLTQNIIAGFGHLEKLGIPAITPRTAMEDVLLMAIHRCDEKMYTDYIELKKKDSTLTGVYLDNEKIQYLYARSFFTKYPLYMKYEEAFNFWKKKVIENWQNRGLYLQGMIALMCHRYNDDENAEKIMRSVLDNAVSDKDMGLYFQQEGGYYWYEAPIERQALLIEATDEILHDTKSVDEMKVWLLKNKQTHSWKSPRATSEAVYALLLRGTDWTKESLPAEIQLGGEKLDLTKNNPEEGTGYVKMSWDAEGIRPDMSKVMITNRNNTSAWGALYWQYFEKLDNLTEANSGLSIKKDLFLKSGDNKLVPVTDATQVKAGDELKVRLIIRTDRDMEFVHIKDMRASGLEPVNVLSGSRYQDGLYYYEATKDASTNFFIDRLPKGTYVFEYPLKVTYNGTFSNGIAEIQCLYAPEFRSHSGETHLRVE